MKILTSFLLLLIIIIFLITFIGCDTFSYKGINEEKIETINNIYFNYPVRDYPIGNSNNSTIYWDSSENDFGNYLGEYNGLVYDGFHPGEDWNLKGGEDGSIDLGKPVYSIGKGKVVKISDLGSLGYLVAIEHNGNFVIPAKEISSNGQNVSYKDEVVNKIYSVYMHLKDIEVNEGDDVYEDTVLGYIMDPGGGPHLHFEIRHPESIPSSDWSMVYGSSGEYDKSNWQKFPDGGYNGYYIDLQKMIDSGLRDPSEFIEANYKSGEEYKSQEEIVEEVIDIDEFIGSWRNLDPDTGSLTKVQIRMKNNEIFIHMWGKCHPEDCDWGEEKPESYDSESRTIFMTWQPGFVITNQQINILSDGNLQVKSHEHFIDESNRADYDSLDILYKVTNNE